MSFLWFRQGAARSAVVDLSELEASSLLLAAGTGLLGPRVRKYADLGGQLADVMRGRGTLFVTLDGQDWPDGGTGKRPFSDAPDALRARLRASLDPALARYGAIFRESAIMFVPAACKIPQKR